MISYTTIKTIKTKIINHKIIYHTTAAVVHIERACSCCAAVRAHTTHEGAPRPSFLPRCLLTSGNKATRSIIAVSVRETRSSICRAPSRVSASRATSIAMFPSCDVLGVGKLLSIALLRLLVVTCRDTGAHIIDVVVGSLDGPRIKDSRRLYFEKGRGKRVVGWVQWVCEVRGARCEGCGARREVMISLPERHRERQAG